MLRLRLRATVYERAHRRALLDLLARSPWTQLHLDWFSPSEWIDAGYGRIFLAWQGGELAAAIGLSPPLGGWSWIRLLSLDARPLPGQALRELWAAAESDCLQAGSQRIAVLCIEDWLPGYLAGLGFVKAEDIISMRQLPQALPAVDISIRPAEREHLPQLRRIDRLAFPPPWQLARHEMWRALRLCSESSIALVGGRIAAFQLCSREGAAAHLARLAVEPAAQRQGIGSALLAQLLSRLRARQVHTITVNTQASNISSQRLYQRLGFARAGYDLEMWRKTLG